MDFRLSLERFPYKRRPLSQSFLGANILYELKSKIVGKSRQW